VVTGRRAAARARATAVAAGAAAAPVDALELALALALVTVGTAAWFALVAATFGLFGGPVGALFALLAGGGVALAVARRLRLGATVSRPRTVELAATAVLLLLGVAVLARPHEYVLGGLDPGVYVNTAALIAREGGLIWQDGTLAALPDEAQLALFREPPGPFVQGSRLTGFYLRDLAAGEVVPHGMHLFPAALAIGYALLGLPGALLVPSLLAGLAVGAVSLLARRLAGGAAGAAAALLLLLSAAESWFGRYPAAETAVQAFLFGGLLLLLLALDRRSQTAAWLAGAAVGMAHLAKIETIVVPVGIGLLFGWLWLRGRVTRPHAAFLFGYAALLAHAALHAALISTQYATSVYGRSLPGAPALAAAALAAVAVGALLVTRRDTVAGLAAAAERRAGRLWTAVAVVVVLLLAFAWLLRPLDPFGEIAASPESVRFMTRNRLEALPRLGWYFPPIGLLAAAAGALVAARRRPPLPVAIVLVLLPLEALLMLSDPRITATYPWAARRWVGILIPAAALFAAAFVAWLPGLLAGAAGVPGRAASAVAGALAAAMVALSALSSAPLLAHRELAGSAALVDRIAARIDPVGVVLLDDEPVGWFFSAPLQLLAGRSAFVTFGEAGKDERAAAALASWQQDERPLYWLRLDDPSRLVGGVASPFDRWGRRWEPVESWRTALPEVVPTTDAPPRDIRLFAVPVTLYRAAR
jgi:4-amino-4-deoxy-L-arabinose transferase-like glycosyltransferase